MAPEVAWQGLDLEMASSLGVTRREAEVLGAVVARLTNAEIAAKLFISERTVESHVSALLRKLDAKDRSELIERARALAADTSRDEVADRAGARERVPRGPHRSIPTPLTSLLGRHDELTTLPSVLAGHRLVTLTGAGGVGKTRLAQQLAADLIDRHPGGTWWVELAPAVTAAAVMSAVADGVQLSLQPVPEPAEQLAAHLDRMEPVLLVLDNCEHVIDTVTPLSHRLLTGCPSLSILATSRERLGVPGEQIWRVASLGCPHHGETVPVERLDRFDAVRLFVDRARETRPDFAVDATTAPHIAAICARLDGIPLAIELAAARTRSLPVERVSSGLDDAFRLLTGGSLVVVPRQQTLLASIAWSYDLLDDTDRAVLRRLAVCPTWFDIDAAEAVAADDTVATADVLDSLTRLVDKSLLEYDDATGHYRTLETIRQFAHARLIDADEQHAARRRYAEHWATAVMAVVGGGDDWPALRAMLTDVITMFDWAMANDDELASRVLGATASTVYGFGRWNDLHRACDWVLADRPHGPHWAAAVAHVSMMAPFIGRTDVFAASDKALAVARERSDNVTVNLLSVGPAIEASARGDLGRSRALLSAAIANGDTHSAFVAAVGLAYPLEYFGQLDELVETCRIGATNLSAQNRRVDVMETGIGPSLVAADHLGGDLAAAVERLPRQPPGWEMQAARYAAAAGRLAIDRQEPALAERFAPWVAPDDTTTTGTHRHTVAWAAAVLCGDLAQAVQSATAAVDTADGIACRVLALTDLAGTLAALRRWEYVATVLEQVDSLLADVDEPAPRPRARAANIAARMALAAGDLPAADAHARNALRTASGAGLVLIQIDTLETVAAVANTAGDHTTAAGLLAAAASERHRRGYERPLLSGVPASFLATLAAEHTAAWAEGAALTLQQAIDLTQRRSRSPATGPRSHSS